jgi:hypothetical protein
MLVLAACESAVGCGGDSKRIDISGTVTFAGQPVPAGKIYFNPDPAKKHHGPSGYADITDGHFDTKQKGSKGPSGGPLIVRIEGFTADANPEPIFIPYEEAVDIPSSGTKDFNIPLERRGDIPRSTAPPP